MKIFMKPSVAALILLVAGQVHASNVNPFVDLGSAGPSNFQILTLGDCNKGCDSGNTKDNLTLSDQSQVDGNVGVAGSGNLTVNSGTYIYGNAGYGTGTLTGSANITGTKTANDGAVLNPATTAAVLAYNDAVSDASGPAGTTVIATPGSLGVSATTITENNPGIYVLNLTSGLALSGATQDLTLSSTSSAATFVINIGTSSTGAAFTVLNGATITLAGGLLPSHVLYNVEGTSGLVCFSNIGNGSNCTAETEATGSSATVQGVVLAPYRDISLNGVQVDGEIISGNLNVTLNDSTVDAPEPATLMFLTTGLAGLGLRLRRLRRG